MRDTEEFVRLISSKWKILGIVGIPYSAKPDVVQRLKRRFVVRVPQTLQEMEETILRLLNTVSSCFVLDTGGYLADLAITPTFPIVGVVEDTKQGHWRYEKVREALHYPVLSIAESTVKQIELWPLDQLSSFLLKRYCETS